MASKKWLFTKMNSMRVNRAGMLRSGSVSDVLMGSIYFFFYDPKTKATLPYYDTFPLVIPIESYSDGFLGLNLHYLDPGLRVFLLDNLSDYVNNDKMDKTTKMRLSYQLISNTAKLKLAEPCIKRYLYSHIQSRFIYIEPEEWIMACFLPAEHFVKASKTKVWSDSRGSF